MEESGEKSAGDIEAEIAERRRRNELAVRNKAAIDAQRTGRSQLRRPSGVFIP